MMEYSSAGMELTKTFEGCSLTAYPDSAGVWTIGYGHTGKDVHPGMAISQNDADNLLAQDVMWAVNSVDRLVKVILQQGQFDALVDFVFNLGAKAFSSSTLLRDLNAGNFTGASAQFPLWIHSAGEILPGLVRRRAAERAMFDGQG